MTYIHPTAIIGHTVIIEEDCHIGPYCIIGLPAEWKGWEDVLYGVLIKSGTRITGLVTIDSGVERVTTIGSNCYLMKHSYIAHDCIIGDGVTLSAGAKIGGYCEIGEGTNLGMNAVIHQWVKVPEGCMIGMGGVVTKKSELHPGQKYAGNPVRWLGINEKK